LIAGSLPAVGGVPPCVLADRMACPKGRVAADVVMPTPNFVRLPS